MWIAPDVELPQELLDAHAQGRLVLFIGAGVSFGPPSNLPLFDGLVRQLAELARWDKPLEDEALDRYLGEMPSRFDVHFHAHDILSAPESKPNDTHGAVMELAAASGAVRVVTTNFDNHLLTAADSAGIEVPNVWSGPALPLGESFSGLVHLHASLTGPTQELVLDDKDFSRAYMTQAWATRFLLPMFDSFTVLFIGYSHNDTVMSYLARGLPSRTKRYALTPTSEMGEKKWGNLGIAPVSYPVQDGDHGALPHALRAWSTRVRMGLSEHQTLVTEIVGGGPTLTPVDRDYLLSRLGLEEGAKQFCRAVTALEDAQQLDWLIWMEELPAFKALFEGGRPDAVSRTLANWFSGLVTSSGLGHATLGTVQRLGQQFSDELFSAMRWASQDPDAFHDRESFRRWRVLLATSVHGQTSTVSTHGFLRHDSVSRPDDISTLRRLLSPYLQLKGTLSARLGVGMSDSRELLPRAEVLWSESEEILTEHIAQLVKSAGVRRLNLALSDALLGAYELYEAYHGDEPFDGISGLRSAIEPHEQDKYRNPVDAIIDGLRDCGEQLVEEDAGVVEEYWRLDRPLFRRLALHLLAIDDSRTSEEKLQWVLDRDLLYEPSTKHEMYRLLNDVVPSALPQLREQLLKEVHEGPHGYDQEDSEDAQHFDYVVYNLLVWLTRAAPTWDEARQAREALQEKNPVFQPRDHPDLDVVMGSAEKVEERPWAMEEVIERLEVDLESTLHELLSRKESGPTFRGPTWHGVLRQIQEVANARPDLGEKVRAALSDETHLEAGSAEVVGAVIEGWATAELGQLFEQSARVVARLAPDTRVVRSVSRFLLGQIRKHIDGPDTPALLVLREMAWALWDHHGSSFTHRDGTDPVSVAPLYLNSWPGDLAQYWLSEIDRRWRNQRDDWGGLADEEHHALVSLLGGSKYVRNAVEPAFASQMYFLFAADERFATEHVLPLFSDRERARLVWDSYLYGARVDDRILQAGFLDAILDQWERLTDLKERHLHRQFLGLVVSIVSFSGVSKEDRQRLLDQSVLALDGKWAPDFAEETLRFLTDADINGHEVWVHWLRDHIRARLDGIPRQASLKELSGWANVVPFLGESLSEGVEILGPRKIPLPTDHPYRPRIPASVGVQDAGMLALYFAQRLRATTVRDRMLKYSVQKLRENLTAICGEVGVEPLSRAERDQGWN